MFVLVVEDTVSRRPVWTMRSKNNYMYGIVTRNWCVRARNQTHLPGLLRAEASLHLTSWLKEWNGLVDERNIPQFW